MASIDETPVETLNDSIKFIEDCRSRHQAFVNNSEYRKQCGGVKFGGARKWHQEVANRYEEINQILNKLNGGKT